MTKGDIVIVLVAVGVAVLVWAVFHALPLEGDVLSAVVRVDGKETARIRIDGPDIGRKEVKILHGTATIEFGQGRIRLLPLPTNVCPNGICWKTGWISRAGQSIVCVPNHMTITLEGGIDEVDSVIR